MVIKHVYGNVLNFEIPLTVKIVTLEDGETSEREEPFYPDTTQPVKVKLTNQYSTGLTYDAEVTGNVIHISDKGNIRTGKYNVIVNCTGQDGNPYRYMCKDAIDVVNATADAYIEAGIEFNVESYTLEGAVFIDFTSNAEQVQSDWNESNPDSKAYIKNKPTIPTVPTNVSAFVNDVGYLTAHQDISGKEDKMLIDARNTSVSALMAEVNKYYRMDVPTETLAVTLPTISDATSVKSIVFYLTGGTTPAITFTSTHNVYYSNGFAIESGKTYEVNALYNGVAWVVASVEIVTSNS